MNNQLLNYLLANSGNLSLQTIVMNFAASLVLALCIFVSYKVSYSRIMYSARFNASLVMLTQITTLVMSCIGTNIALSLGMVGALSIVRFRTAVKDARDTAYIFWAIAVGICCGVSDYFIAGIGTLFIFAILLVFGNVQSNTRYLLVIRSRRGNAEQIRKVVDRYYDGRAIFRANNSNLDHEEYIYLVSESTMKRGDSKSPVRITEQLKAIDGVASVNMVSQNSEMNN